MDAVVKCGGALDKGGFSTSCCSPRSGDDRRFQGGRKPAARITARGGGIAGATPSAPGLGFARCRLTSFL